MKKVVKNSDLGGWFDFGNIEVGKLNPILPAVNHTPLSYIPSLTGNANNRNEIVTDSQGDIFFIDYFGDALKLKNANSLIILNSNFVNNTIVLNNVPSLTYNVVANASYTFKFYGRFRSSNTTNGCRLNVTSTATGTATGFYNAPLSNNTAGSNDLQQNFIFGTPFITTSVSASNTQHFVGFDFIFNTTSAGSVNVQFSNEIGGATVTLLAGSSLIINKLN